MTQLSLVTQGNPSLQATAPFSAVPRDTAATAAQIAGLFQQGRHGEATAQLAQAKQGQPQAIQDALDRMVSSRLGASLSTPATTGLQDTYATPAEVGSAIRQINEAGNGRPAMPDTEGLSTAQKFDVYSSIVETRGNQAAGDALANGDKVILGLRNENNTLANRGRGVYDDRIVVLSKDADGTPHVREFNRASTEPTAQYDANQKKNDAIAFRRGEGQDVTGDGIPELGRLGEGTVEMLQTTHANPASAGTNFSLRPTPQAVADGTNRIERDSNHDGTFDADDARTDLNDTFKIHSGSRSNTDSAGCTTIYPDDFAAFSGAVRGDGTQDRWQYVLTATSH